MAHPILYALGSLNVGGRGPSRVLDCLRSLASMNVTPHRQRLKHRHRHRKFGKVGEVGSRPAGASSVPHSRNAILGRSAGGSERKSADAGFLGDSGAIVLCWTQIHRAFKDFGCGPSLTYLELAVTLLGVHSRTVLRGLVIA